MTRRCVAACTRIAYPHFRHEFPGELGAMGANLDASPPEGVARQC